MKYVIYGCGMFATIVSFVVLFFSMETKALKQEELNLTVGHAMQTALYETMQKERNAEECVANFLSILETELQGKGELEAEIFGIDVEKGIFRAKVTMTFCYFGGQKGKVESERTVIYDGEWKG